MPPTPTHPASPAAPVAHWWREPELLLLLLLLVAAYCLRVNELPLRGEEPRRAQVGREMIANGDWVVPREQGQLYFSRPPLQNWLIALTFLATGGESEWGARVHSLLATLLTTLLVYGYGRSFLSRAGALGAAVVFLTTPEILLIGSQAESEALFILCVSGSLLLWHGGLTRGWPDWFTWSAAYAAMALGFLTKGPQAPVYFLGAVGLYCLFTWQLGRLFRPGHFVGMLVGAAVILAWAVPYTLAEGVDPMVRTVMNMTTMRMRYWQAGPVLWHMARFPFEVIGSTLPWSLLLVAYAHRGFRAWLGAARPHALFLALAFGVAFPSIWLPPDGQTRYLSPVYPCLALLAGLVIEHLATAAVPSLRLAWARVSGALACVMFGGAGLVPVAAMLFAGHTTRSHLAEPLGLAVVYAAGAAALALLAWRTRAADSPGRFRASMLALTAFLAWTWLLPVSGIRARQSVETPADMARVRASLPAGTRLVSFGRINARFAYYFGDPIGYRDWPAETDLGAAARVDYFCFNRPTAENPRLPFAWQEVGVVSMERTRRPAPQNVVVVGRVVYPTPDRTPPLALTTSRGE